MSVAMQKIKWTFVVHIRCIPNSEMNGLAPIVNMYSEKKKKKKTPPQKKKQKKKTKHTHTHKKKRLFN